MGTYSRNNNAGTSGVAGTSGSSGTSGTSGISGSSGTSGVSGSSGISGTSGVSGTSGTSGTTFAGLTATQVHYGATAAGTQPQQSSDFLFDGGTMSVPNISMSGTAMKYNNIQLTNNGVPSSVSVPISITAQSASVGPSSMYTTDADGWYQVVWEAIITRAGSTSSQIGVSLRYTSAIDNVVKVWPSNNNTGVNISNQNTTPTTINGTQAFYCKASTNIQYTVSYTSAGATAMKYSFDAIVIKI
jgi:hypothetical protein